MIRAVTIYAIVDPRTNEVKYIGMTRERRLERRLSKHRWHSTAHYNPRKRDWLQELEKSGMRPIMLGLEVVQPGEPWRDAEAWWLDYFRSLGAELFNIRRPC